MALEFLVTPALPVALVGPFEGAHLLSTAPITGLFSAPIPTNVRLVAGEIDSTDGQRFLTVAGRSSLGALVEVMVWEKDWDKLVLVLDSPLALCHAARWLAGRLGAIAPSDVSFWRTHDPYGRWTDRLRPYDLVADGRHVAMFVDREVGVAGFKRGFPIQELAGMSYPEALASACVAVGGVTLDCQNSKIAEYPLRPQGR